MQREKEGPWPLRAGGAGGAVGAGRAGQEAEDQPGGGVIGAAGSPCVTLLRLSTVTGHDLLHAYIEGDSGLLTVKVGCIAYHNIRHRVAESTRAPSHTCCVP